MDKEKPNKARIVAALLLFTGAILLMTGRSSTISWTGFILLGFAVTMLVGQALKWKANKGKEQKEDNENEQENN